MKKRYLFILMVVLLTTLIFINCPSDSNRDEADLCGGRTSCSSNSSSVDPKNQSGYTTTLAGSAGKEGSVDGIGASARFYFPWGITTDGTNIYEADYGNHIIRKIVISSGEVTTLAGIVGSYGYADGTGTSAKFYSPWSIISDGTNLYVADTSNHIIRKILISTGEVITLAGSAGNTGSADGIGASARFNYPNGIAIDNTNLYVSDSNNHTIRKIVISTGEVTTVAGGTGNPGSTDGIGTSARFNYPDGIATDGKNLYVTDNWNSTIRKIVISAKEVTTLAGSAGNTGSADGIGTSARFNKPRGITIDGINLYVADSFNHIIRKIDISTGAVTTFAGCAGSTGSADGALNFAKFYYPVGITAYNSFIYVSDTNNYTIRKIVK